MGPPAHVEDEGSERPSASRRRLDRGSRPSRSGSARQLLGLSTQRLLVRGRESSGERARRHATAIGPVPIVGERHPARCRPDVRRWDADGQEGVGHRRDGELGPQPVHRVGDRARDRGDESHAHDRGALGPRALDLERAEAYLARRSRARMSSISGEAAISSTRDAWWLPSRGPWNRTPATASPSGLKPRKKRGTPWPSSSSWRRRVPSKPWLRYLPSASLRYNFHRSGRSNGWWPSNRTPDSWSTKLAPYRYRRPTELPTDHLLRSRPEYAPPRKGSHSREKHSEGPRKIGGTSPQLIGPTPQQKPVGKRHRHLARRRGVDEEILRDNRDSPTLSVEWAAC